MSKRKRSDSEDDTKRPELTEIPDHTGDAYRDQNAPWIARHKRPSPHAAATALNLYLYRTIKQNPFYNEAPGFVPKTWSDDRQRFPAWAMHPHTHKALNLFQAHTPVSQAMLHHANQHARSGYIPTVGEAFEMAKQGKYVPAPSTGKVYGPASSTDSEGSGFRRAKKAKKSYTRCT